MCDQETIKATVEKALAEHYAQKVKKWQWAIGVFGGFVLIASLSAIRDHVLFTEHTKDGHPEVVKEMVREQNLRLQQIQITQGHIQTTQGVIREDIKDLKKNLIPGLTTTEKPHRADG